MIFDYYIYLILIRKEEYCPKNRMEGYANGVFAQGKVNVFLDNVDICVNFLIYSRKTFGPRFLTARVNPGRGPNSAMRLSLEANRA